MSTTDEQRLREAILRILKHHAIPRDGVLESDLIYAALAQQAPTSAVLPEPVRCNWTPYGMVPANGGAWVQHQAAVSEPAAPVDAREALIEGLNMAIEPCKDGLVDYVYNRAIRDCIHSIREALARQAAAPVEGVTVLVQQAPTPALPAPFVDPTDPGRDVETLREHVRHLERRVRQLVAEVSEPAASVDARDANVAALQECIAFAETGSLRGKRSGWHPDMIRAATKALAAIARQAAAPVDARDALTDEQIDAAYRSYNKEAPADFHVPGGIKHVIRLVAAIALTRQAAAPAEGEK